MTDIAPENVARTLTAFRGKIGHDQHNLTPMGLMAVADMLEALSARLAEVEAASARLMVVLNRNDKKGPIPDVEIMLCWLAAQDLRAALRRVKG